MPKIKMLRSVAGVWEGRPYAYRKGQVVAVPQGLADDLRRAKHARTARKSDDGKAA